MLIDPFPLVLILLRNDRTLDGKPSVMGLATPIGSSVMEILCSASESFKIFESSRYVDDLTATHNFALTDVLSVSVSLVRLESASFKSSTLVLKRLCCRRRPFTPHRE